MSEQKVPERPRQVTVAGVMGVAGSALLVVSLFDAMSRLRSVEMRSAIQEFLAEPPGDGLGVSTSWVVEALRGVVLVNGALAAVATVLAVYLFQRHQGARIGFTVAAGVLLITAPVSGGTFALVVAFAATMLWSRPARDWFAGREPEPVHAASEAHPPDSGRPDGSQPAPSPPDPTWAPPAAPARAHHPAPTSAPTADPDAGGDGPPPAARPFGDPTRQGWAPPAYGQQPAPQGWAGGPPANPDRPPAGVVAATVVTVFFAAPTLLVFLVVVAMLLFGQDTLVAAVEGTPQMAGESMSTPDLLAALWVVSAIAIFWCVSALTLAVLAYRRLNWARFTLVVSAAMTVLAGMVMLLSTLVGGTLYILAAMATIALLLTPRAGRWYATRPLPPPYGGGSGGPGQPAYPSSTPAAQAGPPQAPAPRPEHQPQPQRPPSGKPPVW